MIELAIENEGVLYFPAVEDEIIWQTERKGVPGQLSFTVLKDNTINFTEGNHVRLKIADQPVFYGFVFSKKRDKNGRISVTAYDQLRYLKNKDTISYENKSAGEFIQMLAADFNLQVGVLDDTGYTIPSRVEENSTLFDMIQNALDLTLQNKKEMYVLYDDFGKLTLKNVSNMRLDILIDEETGENYEYTSTIDGETYNQVKLSYENEDSGKREIYIAKDTGNINRWGVLQYYDVLQKEENGQAKADALLSLYNHKTRNLSIKSVFGDLRVRAGAMVVVILNLGDINVKNYMLVEKCKHSIKNDEHFMDLVLRGGEFIA